MNGLFFRFLIYSTCNFVKAHKVSESHMEAERMESATTTIPSTSIGYSRNEKVSDSIKL